jgi:hypothetical protein
MLTFKTVSLKSEKFDGITMSSLNLTVTIPLGEIFEI